MRLDEAHAQSMTRQVAHAPRDFGAANLRKSAQLRARHAVRQLAPVPLPRNIVFELLDNELLLDHQTLDQIPERDQTKHPISVGHR
mgnify:FL=1